MTFNFAMQAIDQVINSAAKTHYMSAGRVSITNDLNSNVIISKSYVAHVSTNKVLKVLSIIHFCSKIGLTIGLEQASRNVETNLRTHSAVVQLITIL